MAYQSKPAPCTARRSRLRDIQELDRRIPGILAEDVCTVRARKTINNPSSVR